MAERVTVMLDENICKKLRNLQASMIRDGGKGVSFSKVLNVTLEKGLK